MLDAWDYYLNTQTAPALSTQASRSFLLPLQHRHAELRTYSRLLESVNSGERNFIIMISFGHWTQGPMRPAAHCDVAVSPSAKAARQLLMYICVEELWRWLTNALMSSCQVADCALTSLRVHEGGSLVAVGCRDGVTAVLQLSSSLVDLQPSEKAATLAV